MRALARSRDDSGFTLVEVLVVLLILGILIAILLNSLGGHSVKAHDTEAKSNVRNIAAVVEACNAGEDDYRQCDSAENADIRAAGIALGGGPGQVIVTSDHRRSFAIVSRSKSGNVFRLSRAPGGAAARTCTVAAGDRGGCSEAPAGTW